MTAHIHFAVLAHDNEACVADLVRCLWDLNPGAEVSVFNGGRNPGFFTGQGVTICPASRPLRYGNLTPFHVAVMRWLVESGSAFDYLVTLDQDVLPMRPGLADHLGSTLGDLGYMGARFRAAGNPESWELGGPTVRLVNAHWRTRWQPLLGTEVPYWAFNPGQVFARGLVERLLAFPGLDPLMDLAGRSRVWAIEEVVYPTLAVALGAETHDWAGEHGLRFGSHPVARIRELAEDPSVFLLHRVGMRLASPDQLAVHEILKGLPFVVPGEAQDQKPEPHLSTLGRARRRINRRYTTWHVKHRA